MGKLTKVKNGIIDGIKVAGITVAAAGTFEAVSGGVFAAAQDVKNLISLTKYKIDPDVYEVKKSRFGKKERVNINPITGEMVKDKTGKAPVNEKCIKFY